MSVKTRTVAIVTGAVTATALAGSAVVSAAPRAPETSGPAWDHMQGIDDATYAEMQALMESDATIGDMHQWMSDQGIDVGSMQRDMAGAGMPTSQMHRRVAPPAR